MTVAGVPVNMPTHGHGQGYADANFLIPELISGVQYTKGPYYADEGDFASAGAVNVNYVNLLDKPMALLQGGSAGFGRALFAASPRVGDGYLLYAVEAGMNDGPWVRPDDFRKVNGVLRYTRGDQRGGFSVTAMGYDAKWSSTDQIPDRAVISGNISRFGLIDPSDGGKTSRYSLASEWQRNSPSSLTQAGAYAIKYRLNLFSNGRDDATLLNPKLTTIFGPWRNTELYANAGTGFHRAPIVIFRSFFVLRPLISCLPLQRSSR